MHGGAWTGIALVLLLPTAAAFDAREGEAYDASAGNELTWRVAPGAYWLAMAAAGDDATIDERDLRGAGVTPAASCAVEPATTPGGAATSPREDCEPGFSRLAAQNARGSRVEVEEGHAPTLRVANGSARVMLARTDLQHAERLDGDIGVAAARGNLSGDECRAYHFDVSVFQTGPRERVVTRGDAHVIAAGPHVDITFYDSALQRTGDAREALTWSGDAHEAPAYIQVCGLDGESAYVVRAERRAPLAETRESVPLAGAAAAVVALALAARARRG